MKTLLILVLALLGANIALANSNFVSNPRLPYPPSCTNVPMMDASAWLDEQAFMFSANEIKAYDLQTGEQVPVGLKAYRSPCSEPGRSLIWLQFSLSGLYAERGTEIELPMVHALLADHQTISMDLVPEFNGWGSDGSIDKNRRYLIGKPRGRDVVDGGLLISGERKWVFLLDGANTIDEWWYWTSWLSAGEYNDQFKLVLGYNHMFMGNRLQIDVPATPELLQAPAPLLPLSGRLSGAWVIEGAVDQGIQLAISDQVGERQDFAPGAPDLPLVIFFSQYTFDALGNMLWLTGAAEFEPGASVVTIPIEKVTNGEFRGVKRAERAIVGSVTITSNSCNDLSFEYDYGSLGLGQGAKRLQRIFSLETAGYDCRDYEARVAANH